MDAGVVVTLIGQHWIGRASPLAHRCTGFASQSSMVHTSIEEELPLDVITEALPWEAASPLVPPAACAPPLPSVPDWPPAAARCRPAVLLGSATSTTAQREHQAGCANSAAAPSVPSPKAKPLLSNDQTSTAATPAASRVPLRGSSRSSATRDLREVDGDAHGVSADDLRTRSMRSAGAEARGESKTSAIDQCQEPSASPSTSGKIAAMAADAGEEISRQRRGDALQGAARSWRAKAVIHAQLLLTFGGGGRRVVPRQAPQHSTGARASAARPRGRQSGRPSRGRSERTHAEKRRAFPTMNAVTVVDAGRPHPAMCARGTTRARAPEGCEPEAEVRHAEYHAQRRKEDAQGTIEQLDAERRERDPARDEEKRRNKVATHDALERPFVRARTPN